MAGISETTVCHGPMVGKPACDACVGPVSPFASGHSCMRKSQSEIDVSIVNVFCFVHHYAMPRPKVQESQRRRAAEACHYCRASKKKCSGVSPCTQCQERGLPEQCLITNLPRKFRPRVGKKDPPSPKAAGPTWSWDIDPQISLPTPLCDATNTSPPAEPFAPGLFTLDNAAPVSETLNVSTFGFLGERGEEDCYDRAYTTTTARIESAISLDLAVIAPKTQILLNQRGERGML